jgi:hypothetical protein
VILEGRSDMVMMGLAGAVEREKCQSDVVVLRGIYASCFAG